MFKVGDRVKSKEFGVGQVIEIAETGSARVQFSDTLHNFYYTQEGKFRTNLVYDTSSRDIIKINFIESLYLKYFGDSDEQV